MRVFFIIRGTGGEGVGRPEPSSETQTPVNIEPAKQDLNVQHFLLINGFFWGY